MRQRGHSAFSRRKVAGAALAVCLAASMPAWGTPAEDAEVFLKRGVALRRLHNDGAALQEFRHAFEIDPSPRAAAQMGLAEQALKLWIEADKHLAEALLSRTDPWIKKNRAVLEQQRRAVATRVGHVVVGGEPAGANVFLNGQNAGTIPLREPVTVPPGPVRVEVRSPGYTSTSMSLIVAAGDQGRVDVRLERERVPTVVPPAAGGLRPASTLAPGPPTLPRTLPPRGDIAGGPVIEPVREELDPADRPEPEGPSAGLRTARWVVLGATGVFLAAGVAGIVIREHEVGLFNSMDCRLVMGTGNVVNRPMPASEGYCRTLVDNANNGRTAAIVGLAGAGLLAITSAVLFLAF